MGRRRRPGHEHTPRERVQEALALGSVVGWQRFAGEDVGLAPDLAELRARAAAAGRQQRRQRRRCARIVGGLTAFDEPRGLQAGEPPVERRRLDAQPSGRAVWRSPSVWQSRISRSSCPTYSPGARAAPPPRLARAVLPTLAAMRHVRPEVDGGHSIICVERARVLATSPVHCRALWPSGMTTTPAHDLRCGWHARADRPYGVGCRSADPGSRHRRGRSHPRQGGVCLHGRSSPARADPG